MKKCIAWVLFLICMSTFAACRNKNLPVEGITFTIQGAAAVRIFSGLTGDKAEITDIKIIESVTEEINALDFEKRKKYDGANGYAYSVTWLDAAGNKIAGTTIMDKEGRQILHNEHYYCAADERSIDTDYLRALLDAPEGEPIPDAPADTWGVTLTLENVTASDATLVIRHSGGAPDGELTTGSPYWVERWQDGMWVSLDDGVERAWTMEAWLIPMNGSREDEVNWVNLYGQLPAGQYRLGKEIMLFRDPGDYDERPCYAEFKID